MKFFCRRDDAITRAGAVWQRMLRDPDLLSGLSVGDVEDLGVGLAKLMEDRKVFREIPIPLVLALASEGPLSPQGTIDMFSELLRVPAIQEALDEATR